MRTMPIIVFVISISTSWGTVAETISFFESTIHIHERGNISITENITVEKDKGTRGIVRELPTKYDKDIVRLRIQSIQKDGISEPYRIEQLDNGIRIFIGNKDIFLAPGTYTYTIEYTVDGVMSYAQQRDPHHDPIPGQDALYINITGNGWRLPINTAQARVIFPPQIPRAQITQIAYTGPMGSTRNDTTTSWDQNNLIITTNHTLQPYEGLTVAVRWPAGFIVMPSFFDRILTTVYDNLGIILAALLLLALLLFLIIRAVKTWYYRREQIIIPQFYPPESASMPSSLSYLYTDKLTQTATTAEVVDLAVHGYLTITHKPGHLFKRDSYILHRKEGDPTDSVRTHRTIALFGTQQELHLSSQSARPFIISFMSIFKREIAQLDGTYKIYARSTQLFCWASVFMSALLLVMLPFQSQYLGYMSILFVIPIIALRFSKSLFVSYTQDGQTLVNHVAGFRLFLATTEKERMKLIGTPPTMTPQLYETYLPAAIALGVEKEWARSFDPIFARLAHEQRPYTPIWMTGYYPGTAFIPSTFTRDLTSSLNNAITYSATTVASSSDWSSSSSGWGNNGKGGGSSGGGFGGGGGGSW